jgi:hypothetical protein
VADRSTTTLLPLDTPRPWSADDIIYALKRDDIADLAVIDRHAFLQVGTMEVDLPVLHHADKAVPLAGEQLHNRPRSGTPCCSSGPRSVRV